MESVENISRVLKKCYAIKIEPALALWFLNKSGRSLN